MRPLSKHLNSIPLLAAFKLLYRKWRSLLCLLLVWHQMNRATRFHFAQNSFYITQNKNHLSITPAARSTCNATNNFGRSNTGVTGLNPARGMIVCLYWFCVLPCVGTRLANGLIPREESKHINCPTSSELRN